jgi:hypothetical protein
VACGGNKPPVAVFFFSTPSDSRCHLIELVHWHRRTSSFGVPICWGAAMIRSRHLDHHLAVSRIWRGAYTLARLIGQEP